MIEKDVEAGCSLCRECLALSSALYPECKVEITETEDKIVTETIFEGHMTEDSFATDTSQNIYAAEDNPESIQIVKLSNNRWRNQTTGDFVSDYFKCPWCERTFKNTHKKPPTEYYHHRKRDHLWGLFRCPQFINVNSKCQFKTNFAKDLKEHMTIEDHTEDPLVNCPECKKKFAFLSLEAHYEACVISAIEERKDWFILPKEKCPWCEEYFVQGSRTLKVHKRREHFLGDFKCADCHFQANFVKDLIQHVSEEEHNKWQKLKCPRCLRLFKLFDMESHFDDCKTRDISFKCPWCPSIFNWKPIIKWENRFKSPHGPFGVHKKTVHFWGIFRCPECEFEANFARELVDHMQNEGHISEPSVRCPQCVQEFSITNLSSHYETCVQSLKKTKPTTASKAGGFYGNVFPRKCDFCDHVSASKASYMKHCTMKHFRGKFKCLTCKFVAHFAKDLVEHMQTEGQGTMEGHMANPFVDCPSCKQQINVAEIEPHYEGCVKSIACKKAAMFRKKRICEKCGKTVSNEHYKDHLKIHMRKQGATEDEVKEALNTNLFHYCDKCGTRFTCMQNLKKHIRQEHDKIQYKCEECEKSFKKYKELKQHVVMVHSTDEKYNCEHCGKRFKDLGFLRSHIQYHHEAPRYKCSFCGRMFKGESRLIAHERQHKGERPFKCSVCNNTYTSKSSLAQHEAGAHNINSSGGRRLGWHGRNKTSKLNQQATL